MREFWEKTKKTLKTLGPGFITGSADDDPSGIATYSIAGAQFGFNLSFLSWFLVPLMISIQEACARIGMVSGMGLAGVLKKYYSRKLLIFTVVSLLIANIINIGADLGVMAASLQMVFGRSFLYWLIAITLLTIAAEIFIPYKTYAVFLRIFGFFLLVYIITSFLAVNDWVYVIKESITPHLILSKDYLMTAVGFLGTTISPYLFFWQASEEVEEEILKGKLRDFGINKPKMSGREIKTMRKDTEIGMIFSNLITFFIVTTTAVTLNKNGILNIETPQQAALALKPLAGDLTYLLFAVGIIGIGLQAVPVLAGGVAYAVSETFGFKEGLFQSFNRAKIFYLTIAVSTIIGFLINLLNINSMRALYYSAIINGIIAVPLIFIIMRLADDKRVVGVYKSPWKIKFFGWFTFFLMFIAALLMIIFLLGLL
jgi:Mn2+/Fe2+ NRAMP family transporter